MPGSVKVTVLLQGSSSGMLRVMRSGTLRTFASSVPTLPLPLMSMFVQDELPPPRVPALPKVMMISARTCVPGARFKIELLKHAWKTKLTVPPPGMVCWGVRFQIVLLEVSVNSSGPEAEFSVNTPRPSELAPEQILADAAASPSVALATFDETETQFGPTFFCRLTTMLPMVAAATPPLWICSYPLTFSVL